MVAISIILFLSFFFIGASLGSFIGLLAVRFGSDRFSIRDVLFGRSICDHCSSKLRIYDLVPILSQIILRFKCRYCNSRIDISYIFLEIVSGVVLSINILLFYFGYLNFITFVFYLTIITIFLYLSFFDFKWYLVQVNLVISSIVLLICSYLTYALILDGPIVLFDNLIAGVLGCLYVAFLIFISKGKGMGWGDMWVLLLIGLLVGVKGLIGVVFISILFGALIGVIKSYFVDKKIKGTIVPYIPFLTLGLFIELFMPGFVFNLLFPLL
jgi:leader peptidase (prepilin peptidase) / N-methyltransferase